MDNTRLFSELKSMLDAFDSVCKRNNIHYTLFAGTLLGAIRHNGFIPWDDDLDIAMLRNDYDKLLGLPKTEFEAPYFLQTPASDPGYHKAFIKFRKSNTTAIPYRDSIFHYNHGLFIDIFPYDNVPNNEEEFDKLLKELEVAKRNLHFAARVVGKVGTKGLDDKRKLYYYVLFPLVKLHIITPKKEFRKINSIASKYNGKNTKSIGTIVFSGKSERFIYSAKDYEELTTHIFEGSEYPIPINYDDVLTKTYGDYMTPIKVKSEHGYTIIDLDQSYTEYIKNHNEEMNQLFELIKEQTR